MPKFELSAQKKSCEIFNGGATAEKGIAVIYSVAIERSTNAELKIISDASQPIILTMVGHRTIDLTLSHRLFLEVAGTGDLSGTYEFLGCC